MRITKALFWVSDICAWILLFLASAYALLSITGAPLLAAMAHEPLSWPKAAASAFCSLLVAIGAFWLTRRRPLALPLVLIPTAVALINGVLDTALVSLGFVLLVFGLPFLLAFLELRARPAGRET